MQIITERSRYITHRNNTTKITIWTDKTATGKYTSKMKQQQKFKYDVLSKQKVRTDASTLSEFPVQE